jgi:hypothetical protein
MQARPGYIDQLSGIETKASALQGKALTEMEKEGGAIIAEAEPKGAPEPPRRSWFGSRKAG